MNNQNTENNERIEGIVDTQENKKKFKTPGKKTVRRIILGAILLAILGGWAAVVVGRVELSQETKAAQATYTIALSQAEAVGTTVISKDEAKQAAFDAAGVTEADVKFLKVEFDLDRDDYRKNYDVGFRYGGLEYEFEIDAETGVVLSYEID